MGEERTSPSAGWREVYEAMGIEDDQHEVGEGEPARCPDCGLVVADGEEHRCPLS